MGYDRRYSGRFFRMFIIASFNSKTCDLSLSQQLRFSRWLAGNDGSLAAAIIMIDGTIKGNCQLGCELQRSSVSEEGNSGPFSNCHLPLLQDKFSCKTFK